MFEITKLKNSITQEKNNIRLTVGVLVASMCQPQYLAFGFTLADRGGGGIG